jgi:hypothetical protein
MGNLYTHIAKRQDHREIDILYDLKLAYRNNPPDFKLINSLQSKLKKVQSYKQKNKTTGGSNP